MTGHTFRNGAASCEICGVHIIVSTLHPCRDPAPSSEAARSFQFVAPSPEPIHKPDFFDHGPWPEFRENVRRAIA